jgi:hypothetical protein
VHNNNFIGIASFNIFNGIYVATIFGAAFFFDLFWPERYESRAVKLAWKICSVIACAISLATALAYTYIVASKSAYVTGEQRTNRRKGTCSLRWKSAQISAERESGGQCGVPVAGHGIYIHQHVLALALARTHRRIRPQVNACPDQARRRKASHGEEVG